MKEAVLTADKQVESWKTLYQEAIVLTQAECIKVSVT